MKTQIKAEIVAHSINEQGDELISVLATFPRIILSEVNTHRMLSKNTSSSRAIPFNKMVEAVQNNPFIPIAWQKDHKGMQGIEYITDKDDIDFITKQWLRGKDEAIKIATLLNSGNCSRTGEKVTKQLCNRLLEPFMWTTMLITGSREGWETFFSLRCPSYRVGGKGDIASSTSVYKSKKDAIKDYPNSADEPDINWLFWNEGQAEIHIQALAEAMFDAMNESTPKTLQSGDWHILFGDKIDYALHKWNFLPNIYELWGKDMSECGIKIATARAARLSYMNFDGEIDYEKDIELHDRLLESKHLSPFEHCARAMSEEEYISFRKGKHEVELIDNTENSYWFIEEESGEKGWCNNFKGFIPYRYMVDNKLSM